jgi:hypothetical protein
VAVDPEGEGRPTSLSPAGLTTPAVIVKPLDRAVLGQLRAIHAKAGDGVRGMSHLAERVPDAGPPTNKGVSELPVATMAQLLAGCVVDTIFFIASSSMTGDWIKAILVERSVGLGRSSRRVADPSRRSCLRGVSRASRRA